MQLVDWLDDLCVRFIINLPHEELQSVERICFQIEEAQWFYEDFIRPLDPNLPSMNLRRFSLLMFKHCPLTCDYPEELHVTAYDDFLAYKTRVPVRGAIMLNADMTQAVLVKGWKKGAKWSFPRGKINKEEADLDCAVREVYEETGYDLREAGLVEADEIVKKIGVSMREQDMMLYVFRGVPMDTHFEPRTRKEISKIDWYNLTDLPTLRRKHQVQQVAGQDIKENSFYMVAPFLGPLKAWIKQQKRFDKHKAKADAEPTIPVASRVVDTEELEADIGETTADEAPIPNVQSSDNLTHLVANLGRGHRPSDALPEVSNPQIPQVLDQAAELKRLLSVGSESSLQTPTVEAPAPAPDTQSNPLMAMLHGTHRSPAPPPPHTPLEQYIPPAAQPRSPHGQHHPRPPYLDHMAPPPQFPLQPHQNVPFRGQQPPHWPPQHVNANPMSIPHSFMHPPHRPSPQFAAQAPNVQQAFSQQAPRPYQRTGDPQFAQSSQFPGVHERTIPPASKLPPPKLTAHTLGLLNAFKGHGKPTSPPQLPSQPQQSSQATPRMQQPPALHRGIDSFTSPQGLSSAHPYAPTPPPLQSPPNANPQPAQPKPRSAHQNTLLDLFRSPSVTAATPPPPKGTEPVELSAHPTPGHRKVSAEAHQAGPSVPDLNAQSNLLEAFGLPRQKSELTTATLISGPVNVPDFETVKKNTLINDSSGQSRGPSPTRRKSVEPKTFVPQQILKREITSEPRTKAADVSHPIKAASPSAAANVTTPQTTAFKPQILKRPQQNGSSVPALVSASTLLALNTPGNQAAPSEAVGVGRFSATTAAPQTFDRRETLPADQKNALLSLFGKPSQPAVSEPPSKSPIPPQGLSNPPAGLPSLPSKPPLSRSPIPPAKSPQPPTPKSLISGVISPVSPLPGSGSQQNSPANVTSRSRISSIGDTVPPNIVIPKELIPTSNPTTTTQRNGDRNLEDGPSENLSVLNKGKERSATSPIDKNFLLGFLEDVARRGGR